MSRLAAFTAAALVVVLSANLALASRQLHAAVSPSWDRDRILTILVIGSDAGLPRPGDPRRGRSDAIHIIAVDTRKGKATIVDIPRDSYIGGAKVNAHMVFGGPERLKSVLSSYTGLKLDYYAMTNFRGMKAIVKDMGGLRVTVDQPITDSILNMNMRAGTQKMSGSDALDFSRSRKTLPDGDFGRTRHQGQLLRAAHKQIHTKQSDLATLTELIGTFARNTTTDIPPTQLFRLASLAVKLKPKNVKQVPLKGGIGFVGSESVVHLQPGDAFSAIKAGRIGP